MAFKRIGWIGLGLWAALALAGCNCKGGEEVDGGVDAGEEDAGVEEDGGAGGGGGGGGDGGSDGGGGGGGGSGPLSAEEFCPVLARARCDREAACGFLDPAQDSTCLARVEASCQKGFFHVDAGSAVFEGGAARECVSAAAATRCIEGIFPEALPCQLTAVFKPAAALGSPCSTHAECLSGTCAGGALQCKACLPYAGLDEPCNLAERRCDPAAAFCANAPDAGLPDGGVVQLCQGLLADGAPCSRNAHCAAGLCNFNSNLPDGGPDRCGRIALGEPCGDFLDCVPQGYCKGYGYDGTMVTPGICTARIAQGDSCLNLVDDEFDGCEPPASCLEGQCKVVAAYSLDAGAECEQILGQCFESLYCKDVERLQPDGGPSLRQGVCSERLPVGAPCAYYTYYDTDCVQSATCGAMDTCVARQSANGPCAAAYECKDFLACPVTTLRCEPYRGPGESCGPAGVVCADGASTGLCVTDGGSEGRCASKLADGEPCSRTRPGDCASARCFSPDAGIDGGPPPACQPSCLP